MWMKPTMPQNWNDVEPFVQKMINKGSASWWPKSVLTKRVIRKSLRKVAFICSHNRSKPNIWKLKQMVSATQNYWRCHNFWPVSRVMQKHSEFSDGCKPSGQIREMCCSEGFHSYSVISKDHVNRDFGLRREIHALQSSRWYCGSRIDVTFLLPTPPIPVSEG